MRFFLLLKEHERKQESGDEGRLERLDVITKRLSENPSDGSRGWNV